jgi:hypothetical protein
VRAAFFTPPSRLSRSGTWAGIVPWRIAGKTPATKWHALSDPVQSWERIE